MSDCTEVIVTMPFKMKHFCIKPAGHEADDSEHDCLCGYSWHH